MKIYSVNDHEFKPYGRVVTCLEAAKAEILQALATTPVSYTHLQSLKYMT